MASPSVSTAPSDRREPTQAVPPAVLREFYRHSWPHNLKIFLIYGALIGVLIYVIRVRGSYPDAVAFAVLIMNFAAPFIDYYTQPRTYGHNKKPEGK